MPDITYGTDVRVAFRNGTEKTAKAVGITMGGCGGHVALPGFGSTPKTTKDGVTVAENIQLSCPLENMGAQLVVQAAQETNSQAGDGTTTATVLTWAMVREGVKATQAGMNPMDVKRGMELATSAVIAKLKDISVECADSTAISQVGAISANSDIFKLKAFDIIIHFGLNLSIKL